MAGDYIPPNRKLYLTPDNVPVGRFCRLFQVPDSPAWVGLLDGVVSELMSPDKWRAFGELTPEEAADAWSEMVFQAWDLSGCSAGVSTPYWDDDTDVAAEAPSELQQWYGFVTDPLAPPGELDFVEDITLWLFTGFVMSAFGPSAALYFKSNAPRFYITIRDTNVVELIRVIVDGQEAQTITTPGTNSGEINVPVVADPSITTGHDIYLVKAG